MSRAGSRRRATYAISSTVARSLQWRSSDGDGDLDALVVGLLDRPESVWRNDGTGGFALHPAAPSFGGGNSTDAALGDLDGDGDLDAVVANALAPTTVWLNDGTGAFTPHPSVPAFGLGLSTDVTLGDLDGDGDLDAIVANAGGLPETVCLNDGSGGFAPHPGADSFGGGNSGAVGLGDLDGDGDLDVVVAQANAPNAVWVNGDTPVVPEVVGTGTPASCTEAALDAALARGGVIVFDCGGTPASPVTITVTSVKVIDANTTIDGGEAIVLSGGGSTQIFAVSPGVRLALAHLVLRDGSAPQGGALLNDRGVAVLTDVELVNHRASDKGGAIASRVGLLSIADSRFASNVASDTGGAITIAQGLRTTIANSTFTDNAAGYIGGALAISGGLSEVRRSTFTGNGSREAGGALVVFNDAQVLVSGCTISRNVADLVPLSLATNLGGGGIRNDGNLTIQSSTITRNTAQFGGGVFSAERLTVADSAVSENGARSDGGDGGGIYVIRGEASIERSVVARNVAEHDGGGILSRGLVGIRDSTLAENQAMRLGGAILTAPASFGGQDATPLDGTTVAGNVAANGGGIYAQTTMIVRRSTLTGNGADFGGAILFQQADLQEISLIENSTISGNRALTRGGGIATNVAGVMISYSTIANNTVDASGGDPTTGGTALFDNRVVLLAGTILAGASPGEACRLYDGRIESSGYNLDSDGSCGLSDSTDLPDTDPQLGPLVSDGGPTATHALLAGSPAIDSAAPDCTYIDYQGAVRTVDTDQRGLGRPQDDDADGRAACDRGAVEAPTRPRLSCSPAPQSGCRRPPAGRSTVLLKNAPGSGKHRLEWRWVSAVPVPESELADPVGGTTDGPCRGHLRKQAVLAAPAVGIRLPGPTARSGGPPQDRPQAQRPRRRTGEDPRRRQGGAPRAPRPAARHAGAGAARPGLHAALLGGDLHDEQAQRRPGLQRSLRSVALHGA